MEGSTFSGSTTYTVSNKDELTNETSGRAGGYTNTFSYDNDGNPKTLRGSSLSFNSDDQFNLSGFTYDGDGNPTLYGGASLSFDPEDRLSSVGSQLSMGYREDGLRAWKQNSSGVRTYFIYDGSVPVCELDASGNVIATNTFGPTGLLARHSGGATIYYTFDPQGNAVHRLSNGSVLDAFMFDAYGLRQSTDSSTDPYTGFGGQAGYYLDSETGLELLGYRYYDAAKGRFLTRDPIGYDGGINLYAYCGNNPINDLDPLGLDGGTLQFLLGEGKALANFAASWVVEYDRESLGPWALLIPDRYFDQLSHPFVANNEDQADGMWFGSALAVVGSLFTPEELGIVATEAKQAIGARKYLTYAIVNDGEVVYIGKASGKGTLKQVLRKRLSNHAHYDPDIGDKAWIIDTQESKAAWEGAEQVWHDYYRARGAKLRNIDSPLDWRGRKAIESRAKVEAFFREMSRKQFK